MGGARCKSAGRCPLKQAFKTYDTGDGRGIRVSYSQQELRPTSLKRVPT